MESVIGVEQAQIGCKRVGRGSLVKAFSQHKTCLFFIYNKGKAQLSSLSFLSFIHHFKRNTIIFIFFSF